MLNFLLKTRQKAVKPYLHAWQRNGKHVLFLPLQAFCSAAISRLFCCIKPFVLLLQAVCIATTSRLYCRYKQLVAHRLAKKPIARGAVCVAEVSVCAHNG